MLSSQRIHYIYDLVSKLKVYDLRIPNTDDWGFIDVRYDGNGGHIYMLSRSKISVFDTENREMKYIPLDPKEITCTCMSIDESGEFAVIGGGRERYNFGT